MKTFLFLPLSVFLVASCVKTPTPPVAIPVPPEKTESAQPSLRKTQRDIDNSLEVNIKIDENTKQQNEAISEQRLTIKEALVAAEEIRSVLVANSLSLTDINKLIDSLNNIDDKNKILSGKNRELLIHIENQNKSLLDAKRNAQETSDKLIAKENEADALRRDNVFLSKNLVLKNEEVVNMSKQLTKNKEKLASANVYKYWVFGLIGFISIGIIIMLLMRNLRPF